MAEHNLDPQFRKDVLKAKAKYRKRRKFIIISVLSLLLVVTLVQTFFYIREKKQINAQLKEQSQQIEKLEKEAKVNDVVIDKLKDPQFITDLVRQEYGLSYGGEIIFSLPQQENFLKNAIEAIMQGNIEKKDDGSGRIDDSKLPGSNKDSKDKKNKDDKSESKSEKTNEESSDEESENTSDKKTSSSNSNRNSTNTKKNSNTNNTQSNTRSNNRG
ncbi:septum formation initiator family protein [Gemella sanguinis]|jgi:septum formation initiator family protein|uniref:FtsB family cell division protein n=1 Tax=Gemella sanguinis TaxID=84135 RepID=UPI0028D6DD40|nr:septum formation initiator family protein [Gemella sanguinis]